MLCPGVGYRVGAKGSMVICVLGVVVVLGVEYRVRLEGSMVLVDKISSSEKSCFSVAANTNNELSDFGEVVKMGSCRNSKNFLSVC